MTTPVRDKIYLKQITPNSIFRLKYFQIYNEALTNLLINEHRNLISDSVHHLQCRISLIIFLLNWSKFVKLYFNQKFYTQLYKLQPY